MVEGVSETEFLHSIPDPPLSLGYVLLPCCRCSNCIGSELTAIYLTHVRYLVKFLLHSLGPDCDKHRSEAEEMCSRGSTDFKSWLGLATFIRVKAPRKLNP